MNGEDVKELEMLRGKEKRSREYNRKYYEGWKKRYDEMRRFYERWNGKIVKGVKIE